MPSRQTTRGRQPTIFVVDNCAFAQDCRCSRTGFQKKGWMKNHLMKDHPNALGLAVIAGYCHCCNQWILQGELPIDHFMTTHVRARVLFPTSPAINLRPLSATPGPSMREATKPNPSYPGQIADNQGIDPPDSTMVTQQRPADIANQGRIGNDGASRPWMGHPSTSTIPCSNASGTFPYGPPADPPEHSYPTAQPSLPPAPAGRNTENQFQGDARYPRQGDHLSPQGPSWQGWQGWQ